jgi:diacylglycerol O-acyltransferase / wax synthase
MNLGLAFLGPRGSLRSVAQQHLDRLSSTDASFLVQEGEVSHMHIGGLLIFEGPPPAFEDFLDHIRSRLHLVPRYRHKLANPPLQSGRPLWVDDPTFNLEYHVRNTALPAPGTEDQLMRLAARIHSQQLDRSKPLWEIWLVEGVEGNRFGLISKTHHSLVDGVSGVDLATVLFDLEETAPPPPTDLEPWQPHREPSAAELVLAGMRGAAKVSAALATRAIGAATRPETSLRKVRDAVEGVGEIVWAGLNPAPETPLNTSIGPHRRYAVVRQRLSDYKQVKDTFGGTVNDVVLTVVSGALASWLRSRGVRTEGLEMRALVPVSVRAQGDRGTLGNRLTVMRGPLPVYINDPVARLRFVKKAMDGLKESKQAVGASTLAAVNDLAPPTILAQASRLNFSTRLFNLIVTNIPGPQMPLYVLGHQLQDLFPVAFLPDQHALAVAIMSYNGQIGYGLLGDYDALPDIDLLAEGLDAALHELLAAAAERSSSGGNGRPPRSNGQGPSARRAESGRRTPSARKPGSPRNTGRGAESSPAAGTSAGEDESSAVPILPPGGTRSKRGPGADMRAKRTRRPGASRPRPST